MSGAPPFDAFPDLCSPDDHSQFDIVCGSSDFGQQQQLSRPLYSVTPQTGHTNGSHDFHGQLLFEHHDVPFPATHKDGPLRNALPRIDTKVFGVPPAQMSDGRLHVLVPLSPSNIQYPIFSPSNPKGRSPIPSSMSAHSPAAMGSSDEGSLL